MPRQIDIEACSKCESCIIACPVEAIVSSGNQIQINPDECVDCQTCARICSENCIDGGPDKYLDLRTE